MPNKSRSGVSDNTQYKAYKDKNMSQYNKINKLEKRVLANEKDTGAEEALKIARVKVYGRGRPGQKGWFHPQEQKLLKLIAAEKDTIRNRTKLAILRSVHADKRPTAIQDAEPVELNATIPDQLYAIGIINEKRKNTANARNNRISRR